MVRNVRTQQSITKKQALVLWVVDQHGPITVRDVAEHLNVGTSAANSRMRGLMDKRLVDYGPNEHRHGRFVDTFRITTTGKRVLEAQSDLLEAEMDAS